MSKVKKKPQYVVDMLAAHQESITWWGSLLHQKRDPAVAPHMAPIYQEMSEDLLIGMMEGSNVMVEKLLHATGTYNGYGLRHLTNQPFTDEEFVKPYAEKIWVTDKAVNQMRHYF